MPLEFSRNSKRMQQLENRLKEMVQKSLEVGFFEDEHNSGMNAATLANILENGVIKGSKYRIPPRPFFTSAIQKSWVAKEALAPMRKILNFDVPYQKTLDEIAVRTEQITADTIADWSFPPNSPVTIAIKGENNPLVVTGELQTLVKHRIV